MAPITPFLTEAMYQRLVRKVEPKAPESVHLNPWPLANTDLIDEELMEKMSLAIKVSSLGRAARNSSGIKLRQPLLEAVVVAEGRYLEMLKGVSDLIKDELNVKELKLSQNKNDIQRYLVKPLPRILGKKHGGLYPKIADALKRLSQEEADLLLKGESIVVEADGVKIKVVPDEVEVDSVPFEGYSVRIEQDLAVGVKKEIDEQLENEGFARDIVRRIQALRKDADFEIDDHIETYYLGDQKIETVFQAEGDYIAEETLSDKLCMEEPPIGAHLSEYEVDGHRFKIGLVRVEN